MPADDFSFDALRHQFDLEDTSASPVNKAILSVLSSVPSELLPWPIDKAVEKIKERLGADSLDRIRVMLETCMEEVRRHDTELKRLREDTSADEQAKRTEAMKELLLDAARRAEATRAMERVKRIGTILAHAAVEPKPIDAEEIEEMMRIAMNLGDRDTEYLGELVRIEGAMVRDKGRAERQSAYRQWELGFWGPRLDPEIDSVFSKLESYGLVSRIPPPNNLNISADIQNRYVLLEKGLRFSDLMKRQGSAIQG